MVARFKNEEWSCKYVVGLGEVSQGALPPSERKDTAAQENTGVSEF